MKRKHATRVGWVLGGSAVAAMVVDGAAMWLAPQYLAAEMVRTGPPAGLTTAAGLLAIVCALVYAVPRTSMLGAILITAFTGGGIATHFHIGEIGSPPQLICLAISLAAWGGLWLRSAPLRLLLPVNQRIIN